MSGTTDGLDVDVLIVGAGLSGIDLAARLSERCPDHSYAVLEARDRLGGTWDLFRYPGVRSDSDMYTLSFPFRPWTGQRAIVDGSTILGYLRETAEELRLTDRIYYGHKVTDASFDSGRGVWEVTSQTAAGAVRHTARFLHLATGYYSYESGHVVRWPGQEVFAGEVVHPQQWPEGLDVAGRRVVVIGSGATAVTLVPALVARGAAHVVMLQRSPTWMATLPWDDRLAGRLEGGVPPRVAARVLRAKHVAVSMATYAACRRFPRQVGALLTKGVRDRLPAGYDVATHFGPHYDPWDQRLCAVPDGDLFEAVSSGRAEVVTDTIVRFTEVGLALASGREVEADLVVTATGLRVEVAGGISLVVDGRPVDPHDTYVYRGLMLSGVPNLAWSIGYSNASWTLRADLTARWVCRLLGHMRDHGHRVAVARFDHTAASDRPVIDLSAGYIRRAADRLPRQGAAAPWTVRQSYLADLLAMTRRRIEDGVLELR